MKFGIFYFLKYEWWPEMTFDHLIFDKDGRPGLGNAPDICFLQISQNFMKKNSKKHIRPNRRFFYRVGGEGKKVQF
jgi:hypothetical protein